MFRDEVKTIMADRKLDNDEKGKRLSEAVANGDPMNEVTLKEPLKPKTKGMNTLMLSIHKVYFDAILAGTKPVEFRDWTNEYYKRKCSYEENGKRYLVPFDALVLYVGRGKNALTATVALKDIKCDGTYLHFILGKVLYTNSPDYKG